MDIALIMKRVITSMNVQTVNMVKTVGKIAAQLVIVVIKSQACVNTAVNQDGKATIVKRYVQMAFLVETA